MSDINQDRSVTVAATDVKSAAVSVPAADNTQDEKKSAKVSSASKGSFTATHTMSDGEKWFEWGAYSGMNYWLNLAMSVVITDFFKNRSGKPTLEKFSKWTAGLFSKGANGPTAKAVENSIHTWEYLALTSGGTLLLVPLKIIEDRKRPIVHWLNKKLGVKQTAADGTELTPDQIYIEKEQPVMSWGKVIGRRAVAALSVPLAGHALNYTWGQENITNFVMRGTDGKGGVSKILRSGYVPGGKFLTDNSYTKSWMEYAVLDSMFTKLTALIMWATNGAKKKQMPEEIAAGEPVLPAPSANSQDSQVAATAQDRTELKNKKPQAMANYTELAQKKSSALAVTP